MPTKRIGTHIFVQMSRLTIQVKFTRQQLSKIHLTILYPSVDKLLNIICRSRPDEANSETRRIMKDINPF